MIDILRGMIAPASKAVAALLIPFILMGFAWSSENLGLAVAVSPDELETWLVTALVAIINSAIVYFVRNGATPDPTTSTPEV